MVFVRTIFSILICLSLASSEWKAEFSYALPLYTQWVKAQRKKLSLQEAQQIAHSTLYYSALHGVDPRLMLAVFKAESDFNRYCVSHKGAMGLGQLMPIHVKGMGVNDPYSIEENIRATTRLIRGHLEKSIQKHGHTEYAIQIALARYNAGPGRVKQYGGIPPFKETQNYIPKVLGVYRKLKGQQNG